MSTDCLNKIPVKLNKPIQKDNGTILTYISVPCGKCARCLQRRKSEWAFRMREEMKDSKIAYFVTLTYDYDNLPMSKYGRPTLDPGELTKFFKRLRQHQLRSYKHWKKFTAEQLIHNLNKDDTIKYYACGEYGDARKRPHYHAIIFNASRKSIEKAWTLGLTHIVPANEATIMYVMKYLDKRLKTQQDWRREAEFNTMSEEIGTSYIDRNRDFHKKNLDVMYVTTDRGIRIPMPKYYRLKIFTEDERKKQVVIVEEVLKTTRAEEITNLGFDTYAWLQRMKEKESEHRFEKKIKKRDQD